jgi:hypothetical protein
METQQALSLYYFDLRVVIDNLRHLSAATELQEWVLFTLLTSYKISRTAVNNVTVLGSRVNCPMFLPHFKQIWNFSTHFLKGFDTKFRGNSSNVNCAYIFRQTVRWKDSYEEAIRRFS